MYLENRFAAEVFNAWHTVQKYEKRGDHQKTVPDVVDKAVRDLWTYYTAGHLTQSHVKMLEDRYVQYDEDGKPWPRTDIDWGRVVQAKSGEGLNAALPAEEGQ
jgi:hypothetical protein